MIDEELISELVNNLTVYENNALFAQDSFIDRLDENLRFFWQKCNGGYTKDNYFHFFGTQGNPSNNVILWNAPDVQTT